MYPNDVFEGDTITPQVIAEALIRIYHVEVLQLKPETLHTVPKYF